MAGRGEDDRPGPSNQAGADDCDRLTPLGQCFTWHVLLPSLTTVRTYLRGGADLMDYAEEQRQRWNGAAGHAWVSSQAVLDRLFEPFDDQLADLAAARRPAQLLDVGCGTGSTTVAIARRLGPTAACVGVDISEPMLAAARARAEREGVAATFIWADAQIYPFDRGRFDLIVSRFGVMFFQDSVEA